MGGCCCCSSTMATELNRSLPFLHYPQSEEREPVALASHQATVSVVSTGILVDTNLDTSVPDTYRPPPAPLPYETYVEHSPITPSVNRGSPLNKSQVSSQTTSHTSGGTPESKVKNVECDERGEDDNEIAVSKEMEDEESDDDLKKSTGIIVTPLQDEEDCPICLEEYDMENPKLITKCDHHFHFACILEWMERSDSCPVCDQEMSCNGRVAIEISNLSLGIVVKCYQVIDECGLNAVHVKLSVHLSRGCVFFRFTLDSAKFRGLRKRRKV